LCQRAYDKRKTWIHLSSKLADFCNMQQLEKIQ